MLAFVLLRRISVAVGDTDQVFKWTTLAQTLIQWTTLIPILTLARTLPCVCVLVALVASQQPSPTSQIPWPFFSSSFFFPKTDVRDQVFKRTYLTYARNAKFVTEVCSPGLLLCFACPLPLGANGSSFCGFTNPHVHMCSRGRCRRCTMFFPK
jgi:hypothetical protein